MVSGVPNSPERGVQTDIMRILRDDGSHSRAQLVEIFDLSRTKVAAEVDKLLKLKLVEEVGPAASRGGRRSTVLRLASHQRFIGVDVRATSIHVAITDPELGVLAEQAAEIEVRQGPEPVLNAATEVCEQLQSEVPGQLLGVGLGVPGPVSFRDGVPVAPPIMPGWDRYPVRDVVAASLGVPVVVDNDVNVMAVGEAHSGVAKGVDDFLYIKVGTGIGCGVVVDGKVHRGVTGSAGDIGHVQVEAFGPQCTCGNSGCLEAFFGGAALARDAMVAARSGRSAELARLLNERGELTAADVGAAAAAGDPVATDMIRDGGQRLGDVIAALVSFLNPGLIVIGGGVARLGHRLLAEIRSVVYRRSAPLATGNLPIVLSEMGDEAGVVGAARLASDRFLRLG